MESQARLLAGWNLYRALRTYAYPQDLMQRARDALEPGAMLHFIDGHARYIAHWHNLDTPAMIASIGQEGVNLIIRALAYEIRHGSPPEHIADVMVGWLPDERLMPISFSVEEVGGQPMPRISINPLPYKDAAAFAQHLALQLMPLYDRTMGEFRVRGDELTQAEEGARKEFRRTAKRVGAKVEQIVRERGRQVLDSPGSWDDAIEYYRKYNKWPYNPESGLTRPEFEFYWRNLTLDEEGHIRFKTTHERRYAARQESTTRHDTRTRAFPSLALHAGWWAANRAEGMSMRSLARRDGFSPSTVSEAMTLLERRYVLSGGVRT
jgi:hypothetical protein